MEKTWLKHYPSGVVRHIEAGQYSSLVALLDESFKKYRDRAAYRFMRRPITFGEVDDLSRAFAAYLQSQGFVKGDRVAVMMPNVPQYPVALAGILRAGCVLVNVNPLYTPRELEHQLKDSGAKGIVILENFASTLQQVAASVPAKKVIVASMGDLLGFPMSFIVNGIVRHVKKLVPACARRSSAQTTSPCCSTQAAPPASARAPCCCTATWWPTRCNRRPGISPR